MTRILRIALACTLALAAAAGPARAAWRTCGPSSSLVIDGVATPDQERGFILEPFEVAAGTTRIGGQFEWSTQTPLGAPPSSPLSNTLDLGLREPNGRMRGWNASTFTFDAQASTRTYHRGAIPAGEWTAEIGVAAVFPLTTAPYRLTLTCSNPAVGPEVPPAPLRDTPVSAAPGWYDGDVHVHSSNGSADAPAASTPDANASFAEAAGLDWFSLTDHNSDKNFWDLGDLQTRHPNLLILPGAEVTTYNGHANQQGAAAWVDYRIGPVWRRGPAGDLTPQPWGRTINDVFDDVHALGGLTQVNHPTQFNDPVTSRTICRGCSWGYDGTDWSKVDLFEIQTAPPGLMGVPGQTVLGPNPFTVTAIAQWERLLNDGYRITAVGGSDAHRAGERRASPAEGQGWVTESIVGTPTTSVQASALSQPAIMDGLKRHRAVVKFWGASGPDLRLEASDPAGGRVGMGEELTATAATLHARVIGGPAGQVLRVVHNGVIVAAVPVLSGDFTIDVPATGTGWWRIETVLGISYQALSNPIWISAPVL